MRFLKYVLAVASALALCAGSSWAQANAQPKQFGGLKLVDPQNPRGLETDISMRVDADRLILVDPVRKVEVKSLPYSSITTIDETFSITPPLPAGVINKNSTGSSSMPSYMGKEPRHWWTIHSGDSSTIIRISSQVYKNLKTAVGEHNVKIEDADAKKKEKKAAK